MIGFEQDASKLLADISALPERLRVRFMAASKVTAERLEREMQARLRRQLGPGATGRSVESISHREAYDHNGYVVLTDRNPFANLPLWLEKGTKPGKRKNRARTQPRPFWWASIELEAPGHERLIRETWDSLAAEVNQ